MPLVRVSAREVETEDRWAPAIESGVRAGLDDVGAIVRDRAVASLESASDPWGAAVYPLSPTTLRLYAMLGAPDGSLESGLRARTDADARKVTLRVTGRARRYAYIRQFGNPHNLVFGEGEGPIPPRAFLPIRPDDSVDLPQDVAVAVREALLAGIRAALARG